ncbi:unnamed protein product [Prorocentrum cordatum]|uniref:Subtilisin n=1 Tax=Prorocentrum cordatum TaxID=2364126 RepID=A0ABN9VIJ2_9DINO|nr:unnamed protein product [Polarella glacialis]
MSDSPARPHGGPISGYQMEFNWGHINWAPWVDLKMEPANNQVESTRLMHNGVGVGGDPGVAATAAAAVLLREAPAPRRRRPCREREAGARRSPARGLGASRTRAAAFL